MARWQAHIEAPLTYDYGRYTVCKAGAVEPGAGDAAAAGAAEGLRPRRPRSRPAPDFVHSWSNAPSSPSPTARSSTAIPTSSTCRSRRCCRTPTTTSAASWSATRRRSSCARARSRASARVVEAAPRRRPAPQAVGAHGRGRADGRPHRRGARRHRAFRHHRPGRQHGLGDAVRRLAAILAGDPGARLLPRHARADVLARGGPSRPRWRRASGRAPRCRPRWRCATASPISPGARPAATSRTSGPRSSSCATSMPA